MNIKGDYVTFLDDDDFWITKDCLAEVVGQLITEKPDLLCSINRVYLDTDKVLKPRPEIHLQQKVASLGKAEALKLIIQHGAMTRAVWTKVVKASLIKKNEIMFPVGRRSEDTDWTGRVLESARTISWHDATYYAYRRGSSCQQTAKPITPQMVSDLSWVIDQHVNNIGHLDVDDEEKKSLYAYLAYPFCVLMAQASSLQMLSKKNEQTIRMKEQAQILMRADYDPVVHKVSYFYKMFGFFNTARALGVAFKKKYPQ